MICAAGSSSIFKCSDGGPEMIFITGGIGQGKRDHAEKVYGIDKSKMTDGRVFDINTSKTAECIYNYHELIRRLIKNGIDPEEYTKEFVRKNAGAVVIMNEVGCGIIPAEKEERLYREAVGWCGCILAGRAEKVIRIICGIPIVLKEKK